METDDRLVCHPDAKAFLATMAADPDDDEPRLVFADWLDDHGDHCRAEYVRLACRVARAGPTELMPERARLSMLERDHSANWLRCVPRLPGVTWGFRRGLPGFVHVANWGTFRQHAAKLFRAAPVEAVEFEILSLRGAESLAESIYLRRIRELDLCWFAVEGVAEVRTLVTSPYAGNLRTLNLYKNTLGDAGARVIANAPELASLRVLRLDACDIGPAGGRALAESPYLNGLEWMELGRNPLGDEAETVLRRRWGARVRL